ncbi:MAG: zinc-ribbon domain-containing protein [Lachnospiraceae bacterium]|nr:zinc-ribbon domain-containing protein [Lachnospiraceae bacterium]
MKYCNNCGNQLKDEASFCTRCGARQPDIPDMSTPIQPETPAFQHVLIPQKEIKPKKTKQVKEKGEKKKTAALPVVIVAAAVSIIAIAIILFVLLMPDKADQVISSIGGNKSSNNARESMSGSPATGIMLNVSRKTLSKAETFTLEVSALPAGSEMTDVTWFCSDDSVATVSDGVVTAVEEGKAYILVSDQKGNAAVCLITVGTNKQDNALSGFGDLSTRLVSVSGTKPNNNVLTLGGENMTDKSLPKSISAGGYIMDNGYIITASNVADHQENLVVTMPDGTNAAARLISNDVSRNIAILEIIGHMDLSGEDASDEENVGSVQTISSDIGFTKTDILPNEGDTLYVIGFSGPYQDEATVREVKYVDTIEQDGDRILVIESDEDVPGGLITDMDGNVLGISMLSLSSEERNLALSADDLERSVETQIDKVNQDVFAIEEVPADGRSNIYLDAAEAAYDIDVNDIFGQYDSDNWWRAETISENTGMQFTISQRASDIIMLKYSAPENTASEFIFSFGSGERSKAIAYTDQGEYECLMNRHSFKSGEQGEIVLYFEGIKGELQKIVIDNVVSEENGLLEIEFETENPMDEIMDLVLAERRKAMAEAYKEILEEDRDWLEVSDEKVSSSLGYISNKKIAFADITGDGLDEMIIEADPGDGVSNSKEFCKSYEVYGYSEGKVSLLYVSESRYGVDDYVYMLPDGTLGFAFYSGNAGQGSYSNIKFENSQLIETDYGYLKFVYDSNGRTTGYEFLYLENGKENIISFKMDQNGEIDDFDKYCELINQWYGIASDHLGHKLDSLTWTETIAYLDEIING